MTKLATIASTLAAGLAVHLGVAACGSSSPRDAFAGEGGATGAASAASSGAGGLAAAIGGSAPVCDCPAYAPPPDEVIEATCTLWQNPTSSVDKFWAATIPAPGRSVAEMAAARIVLHSADGQSLGGWVPAGYDTPPEQIGWSASGIWVRCSGSGAGQAPTVTVYLPGKP